MATRSQDNASVTRAASPENPNRISLSVALGGHDNSLGLLRLVLASLVIFSHAFPTGGWGEDPTLGMSRGQETIGGFAVVGFFAISGYLIAKSGASSDILQFLWRRVLRIFPAFWTVLLVSAVIVGPIIWVIDGNGIRSYLSLAAGGPVAYFTGNWALTIHYWGIFDIFANTTPYGDTVKMSVFNGSIWTLTYEWSCYLIIAAFVLFGVLKRARFLVLILTVFYFAVEVSNKAVPGSAGNVLPFLADNYRVTLALAFLIGSCLAMYSREIPFDNRLGIFCGVVILFTLREGGWVLLGYPALAYFLMWVAAWLPKRLRWIGAKNDYSYGIYIYGFLVQQITAYFGWYKMGYVPWVLAVLIITAGCAWLSWHIVEKRALALKEWGPGRGIRYWYERAVPRVRLLTRRSARVPAEDATPGATE
jgi:peptidoglycan/LPS O-acetylase OafA/YrhL